MHSLAKWQESGGLELRVQLLKAVAHPVRLCMVATLAERPLRVTELAEVLGVAQPIVSQQLRILRMMELVRSRRDGGRTRYELAEPHLHNLLACLESCCATRDGVRAASTDEVPPPVRRAVRTRQAVTRRRGARA